MKVAFIPRIGDDVLCESAGMFTSRLSANQRPCTGHAPASKQQQTKDGVVAVLKVKDRC